MLSWIFSIFLPLLLLASRSVEAKEKPSALAPLPGTVIGNKIFFEGGRVLEASSSGRLTLFSKEGTVLAAVDLQSRATKESSTEALGIEVEESDLGGGGGNAKKYLGGKKAPRGRALDASSVSNRPALSEGQSQVQSLDGVKLTTVTYPNGATLLKWQWSDFLEEVYFDRRRSLVYNQQSRRLAGWDFTLQQFADGSFSRSYSSQAGALSYTFDANDQSYRFSFSNPQQETLLEVVCQESCRQ